MPRPARPTLETLDDRCLPATFLVTTVANAGEGSLRQAILDSNATTGVDTIAFAVGGGGVQAIRPTSALPTVTDPVVIDGTTQPGFAGTPVIVLTGGLTVAAGDSTVRGLVLSTPGGPGLVLQGGGGNVVAGNFIGTDVTGTAAVGNFTGVAVSSSNNRIGGPDPADRNVISGNSIQGVGIFGGSTGNLVQGNYIGTDVTGTRALSPFQVGVSVGPAGNGNEIVGNLISGNTGGVGLSTGGSVVVRGNFIGTDATGTAAVPNANNGVGAGFGAGHLIVGNLISGNLQSGISLNSDNNVIRGNLIGTDVTGTRALGNRGFGVSLGSGRNTVVGGAGAGEGNVISGNLVVGINGGSFGTVIRGNFVGTDVTGTEAVPNGIGLRETFGLIGGTGPGEGNVISGNTGAGILVTAEPTIQGNYIGTDVTGLRALGNGTGILMPEALRDPRPLIGGAAPGAGNVISGNLGDGIAGRTSFTRIEGNRIGTDATGTAALGNGGNGINLAYAEQLVIGGAGGARNVISGNALSGIALGETSSGVQVRGNLIGTTADGSAALGNGRYGVLVESPIGFGTGNVIGGTTADARNVISGNGLDGVRLGGLVAGRFRVQGNYIGTDATGTRAVGNADAGVVVDGGLDIIIGGTAAGAGNLIAGNGGDGVELFAVGVRVEGNRIGTDAAGTAALGNRNGVSVSGLDNVIGGAAPGAGNLIAGYRRFGVELRAGAADNRVEGNRIGVTVAGTQALGGVSGVVVANGAAGNVIGGAAPGAGNVISGNANDGVVLTGPNNAVRGNRIGTTADGSAALGNRNGVTVGGSNNTVGGAAPGAGNLISGGRNHGVEVLTGSNGNLISGNRIGTDAAGARALGNTNGVEVRGSDNTVSGNLVSGNREYGVLVFLFGDGLTGNRVEGNRIGTDAAGTAPLGNRVGVGLNGTDSRIGGTAPGAGNVISGNRDQGIILEGSRNAVEGNLIGTDVTGTAALGNGTGMTITGTGQDNRIGGPSAGARNVISGNQFEGIFTQNAIRGTVIQGNYIGTDATGTVALGNFRGIGANGPNTLVGGTEPGAGNLISGNRFEGVVLAGPNSRIEGNLIGTDATGTAALGNARGVVAGGTNAVVGGTAPGSGNIISGNLLDGVAGAGGVRVEGNYIGTDVTGAAAVGNGRHGVSLTDASGNVVRGNLISGNVGDGVFVGGAGTSRLNRVEGNLIGTDATGTAALGNRGNGVTFTGANARENVVGGTAPGAANAIAFNGGRGVLVRAGTGNAVRGNSVFANAGPGIELADGGNRNQPAPQLGAAAVADGVLSVAGTVRGAANTVLIVEVFASDEPDPSGAGEGQVFLGSVTVTTDASGEAAFEAAFGAPAGRFVTATATGPLGDTSAFSGCLEATGA